MYHRGRGRDWDGERNRCRERFWQVSAGHAETSGGGVGGLGRALHIAYLFETKVEMNTEDESMKQKLYVYMYGEAVGELTEGSDGHLGFEYTGAPYPLSVRMPVGRERYSAEYAEPFFENMIPEGKRRTALARQFHVSEGDVFSLLREIGGDCAGAVTLYPEKLQAQLHRTPTEISPNDLVHIIDELPCHPLLTGSTHAPRVCIAGTQKKFALCKGADGRYWRSDEAHPTTHVIKITNPRFPDLLQNELFCMTLAKHFFEDAVDVRMNAVEGRPYLEIRRFDRTEKGGHCGRVHQEDFCQVYGIMSRDKYHEDGGPGVHDIFRAIATYSRQKEADSTKMLRLLVLNYLLGNTDAHAKNLSLLHVDRANSVVLSPPYDLVATEVNLKEKESRTMAMPINGKDQYNSLTKEDWSILFSQLNLNPTATWNLLRQSFAGVVEHAELLANRFNADPLTASEIYAKIIANVRTRFERLFP